MNTIVLSLSVSNFHRPDMTEIQLKGRKIARVVLPAIKAPVAQWIKRSNAGLAALASIPALSPNVNEAPLYIAFHCTDVTEPLLERTEILKSSIH